MSKKGVVPAVTYGTTPGRLLVYRIPDTGAEQRLSLVEVALEYHGRGWSIIPIRPGTKRPACRSWEPFQSKRPDRAKLRRWFANQNDRGLAVVLDEVSGGLGCCDFDTMEGYKRWKQQYPDLAETLPTARGRHVYFRSGLRGIVNQPDGGGQVAGKRDRAVQSLESPEPGTTPHILTRVFSGGPLSESRSGHTPFPRDKVLGARGRFVVVPSLLFPFLNPVDYRISKTAYRDYSGKPGISQDGLQSRPKSVESR